jgi:hypothetical protein
MLKTFAAALLAATMITAPVLAAGTTATPSAAVISPAKTGIKASATTNAPVVATQPAKADVKKATVKKGKSLKKARRHIAKHVKNVRHVRTTKASKHAKISHKILAKPVLAPAAKKARS